MAKPKVAMLLAGGGPEPAEPEPSADDEEMGPEDRAAGKADAISAVAETLGIEPGKAKALVEALCSYLRLDEG